MTLDLDSVQPEWNSDRKCDLKTLRPIAQKQIASLLRRMKATEHFFSFYEEEIWKLISYEKTITRGEGTD
jgi:hypothetical protein